MGLPNKIELYEFNGFVANMIFTHNHPNGTIFSEADFDFAFANNLCEIRIVSATKNYSMKRPTNGWTFARKLEIVTPIRQEWYREFGAEYNNASTTPARKATLSVILWERGRTEICRQMNIEIKEF